MSSNSARIEQATRQHVGATLTNDQLVELVKVSFPDWKGGVYPSDAAGQRQEDGTITHRGKVMYGDLVLVYESKNAFKVLPTDKIVRRPVSGKKEPAKVEATPEVKPVAVAVVTGKKKKAGKTPTSLKPPVVAKQKARDAHA